MHLDKWKDIKAMVKEKFKVLHEEKGALEDIPNATLEVLEFDGPQGKMRLEYTIRPVVLDKKTIYSKLGKTAGATQYTYSPDEVTYKFKAFKWNDGLGEWEEVKSPLA